MSHPRERKSCLSLSLPLSVSMSPGQHLEDMPNSYIRQNDWAELMGGGHKRITVFQKCDLGDFGVTSTAHDPTHPASTCADHRISPHVLRAMRAF